MLNEQIIKFVELFSVHSGERARTSLGWTKVTDQLLLFAQNQQDEATLVLKLSKIEDVQYSLDYLWRLSIHLKPAYDEVYQFLAKLITSHKIDRWFNGDLRYATQRAVAAKLPVEHLRTLLTYAVSNSMDDKCNNLLHLAIMGELPLDQYKHRFIPELTKAQQDYIISVWDLFVREKGINPDFPNSCGLVPRDVINRHPNLRAEILRIEALQRRIDKAVVYTPQLNDERKGCDPAPEQIQPSHRSPFAFLPH